MKLRYIPVIAIILTLSSCVFYGITGSNIVSVIEAGGGSLVLSGDTLLLCNPTDPLLGPENGFVIYDVSNPLSPVQTGRYSPVYDVFIISITCSGSTVFCLTLDYDLLIINISDPAAPSVVSGNNLSLYSTNLYNGSIILNEDYAYWCDVILDISDPANPVKIGEFTADTGKGLIQVTDDYAFVINNTELQVFSLADKTAPTLVKEVPVIAQGNFINGDTASVGSAIYISEHADYSSSGGGLYTIIKAVDISEPENPVVNIGPVIEELGLDLTATPSILVAAAIDDNSKGYYYSLRDPLNPEPLLLLAGNDYQFFSDVYDEHFMYVLNGGKMYVCARQGL